MTTEKLAATQNGSGQQELNSNLFKSSGEMGALIDAFDWSASPIGAPNTWPTALRMMVRLLLANAFPMLELFEFVRGGADRMEMLVRDLLAYTRTAMLEKPDTATDATEALKISITNLAATISETGARITFEPYLR